ncbi:MAG TPA: DNA-deoxyinosine glycosylase [Erysipelotrichaceae bacterium]|jgi:hypoxanthine-DNA glycosylase|nr:DNA-deoxyinosine glycosylase [Erysipelotrichaceae bacterium]
MVSARVVHPLDPIIDENCEILILGSFPSVKSREDHFYYAHPQNRFWKVMSTLCQCEVPKTPEEKKAMLLKNHIALWDSIHSCRITGSSDASIKDVVPNDIQSLIKNTKITHIYCNGKASLRIYNKYQQNVGIEAQVLPSTSPANAAYSLDRLIEIYKKTIKCP